MSDQPATVPANPDATCRICNAAAGEPHHGGDCVTLTFVEVLRLDRLLDDLGMANRRERSRFLVAIGRETEAILTERRNQERTR